jgi:PAS domain S-box-containing protein
MSLKYRIAAIIFVLEALMMGVVLNQTISRFDRETRRHLAEAEDVVLDLLTGVGRGVLVTREYAGMQPYLDQAAGDSRVLRAMLADHRGIVVASLDGGDIGQPLPPETQDEDRFWRRVPISNASGISGSVAVEFSNAPLRERAAGIRRDAIAIAVVGMSLIAVVGVLTGLLLTRKLDRVSKAAQRLASGDRQARSGVSGTDEIGRLGRSFDDMASALETERTRLESARDALRESEEHYRSLVENSPVSIHELDAGGRLISMSRSGLEMMGLSEPAVEGVSFLDIVDAGHRERVGRELDRASRGRSSEFEFERTVETSTRVFRSGFYPTLDAEGRVVKILGLAQDITDGKRVEEALDASEKRLRQAQKMEAIGLLAGGVAHDFNNILTVINGYCDLMLSRDPQPERDKLEAISKAAHRATSLTHQLLAFSRQQVLQPRVMNLNAAIVETNRMLRRVIGEDIELVSDLEPALGLIKADPGQIQQVLMNLAVNARDAMVEGGRLAFETRNIELQEAEAGGREGLLPAAYVQLVVRDSGIGMAPDVLAHIFEPFFTTKEVGRGTGLGLSTVYGIVKQSGGYIYVSSKPGSGSVFEILLPKADGVPSASVEASMGPAGRGSGTILLVEDEPSVRELVRDILVTHGYHVLEAADGRGALEMLDRHASEVLLVLTDLVMPAMNGPQLAAHIRQRHPQIRVLFTTGYFSGTPAPALENGDHLLKKPFTPRELLGKLRDVLDPVTLP